MKNLIICFTFLSVIFLVISCRKETVKVEQILQKAESIVEQHPDSALLILDEIKDAEKFKKSLYYEYYLVLIQAKYKSYNDITSDTLVFTISDYYSNKKNIEKTALATFYCGRVYQEQKNYEKALLEFLETEQYLKQSNNLNLKGLCQNAIGEIYSKQHLKEKALIHYKLGKEYFFQAEEFNNVIITNKLIGNCFLAQQKTDSAFVYYYEALNLVNKYDYKNLQASIRMNMGVAYRETGNWEQAENYFKQALEYSTDSVNSAKLAVNFAQIYELQGKNDSAIVYLEEAINYLPSEQNNTLAANVYETWSAFEEEAMDFESALEKYKLYSDYLILIFDENRNRDVIEVEKKYNYQLFENKNKQLLIERQRIVLFSLGLLFVFVLSILVVLRRSAMKERKLREAEHKIYQMKEMARNYNEKENSFRDVLLRHFDILKKTALLEGYLKAEERKTGKPLLQKFNEVVYGEKNLNWDVLYQTLNKLSNGYFEQLRNRLPQLDVSEFRICCLIFVDFNNTEIAIVLNYSVNTVQAKRSSIRRKLGLKTYGNINDFLKNIPQN